jgi:hypothetical protein
MNAPIKHDFSREFAVNYYVLGMVLALIAATVTFVLSRTPGRIYGFDDLYYFTYLPSVLIDGDLDFADELAAFRSFRDDGLLDNPEVGPLGRFINRYGIGYAALSLPFFLLGFPLTFLARVLGVAWDYDGMNPFFQFSTSIATVVWGFAGLALCQRVLRRHFPASAARRSVVLVLLATPLVYYIYMTPTMAHATAFFSVALWLYLWDGRDPRLPARQAIALGAAGALAFLVRYPNALVLLGGLLDWPRWNQEKPPALDSKHWLRFWFIAALTFGICIVPQLLVWRSLYGEWVLHPYANLAQRLSFPSLWDFWSLLFADRRGAFNWHPVLLLSAIGLIASLRVRPWLVLHGLLTLGGLAFVYASHHLSGFGVSFGSRVFVDALPFFAVGLAAFLFSGRQPALRWSICIVLAALNLLVAVSYRSHAIPMLAVVSWPGRVRAFLDVPEQIKSGLRVIAPKLRLSNAGGARYIETPQNRLEGDRNVSR